MPLTWNVSKIKNSEVVTTHPKDVEKIKTDPTATVDWNPVTQSLVWASIFCGWHTITEDNKLAVYKRIYAYERAEGAMRNTVELGVITPIYITFDDVCRHVGLKTNASALKDAQFAKRIAEAIMQHAEDEVRHAEQSLLE